MDETLKLAVELEKDTSEEAAEMAAWIRARIVFLFLFLFLFVFPLLPTPNTIWCP